MTALLSSYFVALSSFLNCFDRVSVSARIVSLRCSIFRPGRLSVERFVVFDFLPNLLNGLLKGLFVVVVEVKSILLSIIVGNVCLLVVVRLRFGLVVVLVDNSAEKSRLLLKLVGGFFVLLVVVGLVINSLKSRLFEIPVGVGLNGLKVELGDELKGLSLSGKKSPTAGSMRFDDEKSASLWNGSLSSHGVRLIGERIPLPHLKRSFPGNSEGRNA